MTGVGFVAAAITRGEILWLEGCSADRSLFSGTVIISCGVVPKATAASSLSLDNELARVLETWSRKTPSATQQGSKPGHGLDLVEGRVADGTQVKDVFTETAGLTGVIAPIVNGLGTVDDAQNAVSCRGSQRLQEKAETTLHHQVLNAGRSRKKTHGDSNPVPFKGRGTGVRRPKRSSEVKLWKVGTAGPGVVGSVAPRFLHGTSAVELESFCHAVRAAGIVSGAGSRLQRAQVCAIVNAKSGWMLARDQWSRVDVMIQCEQPGREKLASLEVDRKQGIAWSSVAVTVHPFTGGGEKPSPSLGESSAEPWTASEYGQGVRIDLPEEENCGGHWTVPLAGEQHPLHGPQLGSPRAHQVRKLTCAHPETVRSEDGVLTGHFPDRLSAERRRDFSLP